MNAIENNLGYVKNNMQYINNHTMNLDSLKHCDVDIECIEQTILDILLDVRMYLYAMKNMRGMDLHINNYENKITLSLNATSKEYMESININGEEYEKNDSILYIKLLKKYAAELKYRAKEIPIFIKHFGNYSSYNKLQRKFINRTLNIHNTLSKSIMIRQYHGVNNFYNINMYRQSKNLINTLGKSISKKAINEEISKIILQSLNDIMFSGAKKALELF